ncbi:hypothetical protein L596_022328 [Steinernema carpocapsae]|uniref:PB1 domain-containing protein n=1 Tax=Steinernema carpocapsae TaxID=34508 RepID=A0A4U5MLD5_STECR|nr:hypothetical protein L596_022328 [Steinernema carpocapsae]
MKSLRRLCILVYDTLSAWVSCLQCKCKKTIEMSFHREPSKNVHSNIFDTLSMPFTQMMEDKEAMGIFSDQKLQWNHFGKKYKLSFTKEEMDYMDLYDVLMRKITDERPEFDGLIAYNDLSGRQIIIRNDSDLRGALHHLKNKLRIYTTLTEKGYMAATEISNSRPPTRSHSVPPTDRSYSPRYSPQDHRSPSSMDSQYRSYDRRSRSPQPVVQTPNSVSPRSGSDGSGYHQVVPHQPPYPPGYTYSYSQYGPYANGHLPHPAPGPLAYGFPPHNFLLSHFLTGGHYPFYPRGGSWIGPNKYHNFSGWNGRGYYKSGWGPAW